MKLIAKNIKPTLLASLLLIVSGCQDFLIKPLQGNLTQENFPTTQEDALLATNAIYQTLRQGTYNRGFYPIDDVMSDDARKGSNPSDQSSSLGPFDNFEFKTTNEFVLNWWRTLYVGIRRSNVVIEYVPQIDMDQDLIEQYVGEAKFLRALFYFDLVRGYGGVPLVTSTNPSVDLERESAETIYNFLEADLRSALNTLRTKNELSSNELGRATSDAAAALLSRAYLYQQDYDSAAYFAQLVINSGNYSLESVFADANSEQGEFGIESIFEVGGIGDPGGISAGNNEYTIGQGVRGVPNRGFGFNRPSLDLINAFDPSDPRMEATVIFLGEIIDGIEIVGDVQTPDETYDENNNLIEIETYSQKVWVPGTTVSSSQGHNRRLFRFDEILLNAAEALNETGQTSEALMYLNMIRQRAREGNNGILPDITETNKDALRDIILDERRFELAMEGHRFWDLVRTGKAQQVLGPLGFNSNKNELLPIPQVERDLTGGKLTQNPGWEE